MDTVNIEKKEKKRKEKKRKENVHKTKKKPKKTTTTNSNMDMDTCMNKKNQAEDTRFIINNNNNYSLGTKVSLFSYCSSIIGG